MSEQLKPSEVKILLQSSGIGSYEWKGVLNDGSYPTLILENRVNKEEVIGKIISLPSEGELRYWPRLQHPNLHHLLDVVDIKDSVKIFISSTTGKNVTSVINDYNFIQHPQCLERKKKYIKDILLGLDYMHHRNIYHLNLNGLTVTICGETDKAVICNFHFTVGKNCVLKELLPEFEDFVPPEILSIKSNEFVDCLPIDLWACGILFLQIFTQHLLPWKGISIMHSIQYLDNEILKRSNIGSRFQLDVADDLRKFLQKLLLKDPNKRLSAAEAYKSNFLQSFPSRMDETARNFWRSCERLKDQNSLVVEGNFMNDDEFYSTYSVDSDLDAASFISFRHSAANFDHLLDNNLENSEMRRALAFKTVSEHESTLNLENEIRMSTSGTAICRNNSNHSEISLKEIPPTNREYHLQDSVLKVDSVGNPEFYDAFLTEWDENISPSKVDDPTRAQEVDPSYQSVTRDEQFSTNTCFSKREHFTSQEDINCNISAKCSTNSGKLHLANYIERSKPCLHSESYIATRKMHENYGKHQLVKRKPKSLSSYIDLDNVNDAFGNLKFHECHCSQAEFCGKSKEPALKFKLETLQTDATHKREKAAINRESGSKSKSKCSNYVLMVESTSDNMAAGQGNYEKGLSSRHDGQKKKHRKKWFFKSCVGCKKNKN